MNNKSREIASNQTGIHPRLREIVQKHCTSTLRSPFSGHTQAAFDLVSRWLKAHDNRPLILDSGCGTGMSTGLLARQYPESNVIGIDRSIHRLNKTAAVDNDIAEIANNACLLQADLVDFWRLALAAGWQLSRHTIYYPNPYPKSAHLQRRWHGHGVFPTLLKLGGEIELRSNWRLYLEEFSAAIAVHDDTRPDGQQHTKGLDKKNPADTADTIEILKADRPMTLFEKKYRDSGQPLYRLTVQR